MMEHRMIFDNRLQADTAFRKIITEFRRNTRREGIYATEIEALLGKKIHPEVTRNENWIWQGYNAFYVRKQEGWYELVMKGGQPKCFAYS